MSVNIRNVGEECEKSEIVAKHRRQAVPPLPRGIRVQRAPTR